MLDSIVSLGNHLQNAHTKLWEYILLIFIDIYVMYRHPLLSILLQINFCVIVNLCWWIDWHGWYLWMIPLHSPSVSVLWVRCAYWAMIETFGCYDEHWSFWSPFYSNGYVWPLTQSHCSGCWAGWFCLL